MKSKADHEKILFKAGIFIIFTVALLIFSILWLRYFAFLPDKVIIAKFKECGPISTGMPTYYQGVDIGKATNIDFSKDFRYTLVRISIYKKCMNLPKNVYAVIKTQGLTGQKYVDIVYPEVPSSEILENRDVIEGKLSNIEYIVKGINNFISRGQINEVLAEIKQNANHIATVIKKTDRVMTIIEDILRSNRSDIRKLINEGASSASNLNITTDSIKNISSSPELNKNINSTVTNFLSSSQKLDKAMSDIDKIVPDVSKIVSDVDKVTGNQQFQESIVNTFYGTDCFMKNLNSGELNYSINKLLNDTDRTVNRYDCIGGSLSELMNERFLLMRLMFGKPGKSFEKCTDWDCLMQHQKGKYPP